jgi:hypothetical protein
MSNQNELLQFWIRDSFDNAGAWLQIPVRIRDSLIWSTRRRRYAIGNQTKATVPLRSDERKPWCDEIGKPLRKTHEAINN